ncbi:hypothetical protein MF672_010190 [Actinomadura sp. ATCC 31491]|uniref:Peptidase M15A C-terminal domain-containing protein n=1 Tax=Actinomadura luzonensis TaxID=2805427 RepID=A0ABT0FPU2_9ACTN|nr:hypothetical protein [Actinomadura luzonensis]MCK2214158.1 hypothetical protein [Actinomadura luzonensis]
MRLAVVALLGIEITIIALASAASAASHPEGRPAAGGTTGAALRHGTSQPESAAFLAGLTDVMGPRADRSAVERLLLVQVRLDGARSAHGDVTRPEAAATTLVRPLTAALRPLTADGTVEETGDQAGTPAGEQAGTQTGTQTGTQAEARSFSAGSSGAGSSGAGSIRPGTGAGTEAGAWAELGTQNGTRTGLGTQNGTRAELGTPAGAGTELGTRTGLGAQAGAPRQPGGHAARRSAPSVIRSATRAVIGGRTLRSAAVVKALESPVRTGVVRLPRIRPHAVHGRARVLGPQARVDLTRVLPRQAAVRMSHAIANGWLRSAGLRTKSTGNCASKHQHHCTSLDKVRTGTVARIIQLKQESRCPIMVTGGTEEGHAPGRFSHGNGYKLDISHNSCIDHYITKNHKKSGVRGDGARLYRSASGTTFADEIDHWDILFR